MKSCATGIGVRFRKVIIPTGTRASGSSTRNRQLRHAVLNGAAYSLTYDVLDDFEPVALLSSYPLLIVSKNAVPARDLKELVVWLKTNGERTAQADRAARDASGRAPRSDDRCRAWLRRFERRRAVDALIGAQTAQHLFGIGDLPMLGELSVLNAPDIDGSVAEAFSGRRKPAKCTTVGRCMSSASGGALSARLPVPQLGYAGAGQGKPPVAARLRQS